MSSDYQSSKKADVFVDSSGTESAEYCNKFWSSATVIA